MISALHNEQTHEAQSRLIDMLTTALGPVIGGLMDDESVIEIMVNPDGKIWIDRLGQGRSCTGHVMNHHDAERVILLVASSVGAECSSLNPLLSAELPGCGSRFQGVLPPVVESPCFTIRKKAVMVFTLDDYVRKGIMTEGQKECMMKAVHEKQNILIAGGTSSGKTTFANSLLHEIGVCKDRVVIIEDTLELQCSADDVVFLRTREGVTTMNDLIKATLRLRPDRIIVGEVRGREALDLLKSWNTGHPGGVSTIHANGARQALTRLEQLIQEAVVTVPRCLIAEAVNVIVFIEKYGQGRRVKTVAHVTGMAGSDYVLEELK
jgi:P-type conjugative transfer ATPase TrbB